MQKTSNTGDKKHEPSPNTPRVLNRSGAGKNVFETTGSKNFSPRVNGILGVLGLGRILHSRLTWIFTLYLAFFALFFWGIHGGVGHYWDWSFPYFGDQLGNLFSNKASSWIAADMGSPLDYSSDYFLRFTISLFGFLPPEFLRYGLFAILFAAGGLGVFMIARRHTSSWLAFLLGLVAFVNPAMFYKYTAGHFNYVVALVLFIFFVYFLLYEFDKSLRSAVITGLFLALMGVQIQFFVIAAIFLTVFFAFNRARFGWRYITIIFAVPLLIHLVWLSNFLTGATSATETGATASKMSFKAASASDFLSIFTFSFSKATLLAKFYALYELLWNASLFIFMLWLLVREKQKQIPHVMLLIFLAVMIFMATGLYQTLNLGPVTALYPMLREVGHFAPIIVLTALLLIARLVQKSGWRWALVCILVGSLAIVGVKFQYYSQAYSFGEVRDKFEPFKQFAERDTGEYRILAYPFFGKYSFNHLPKDPDTVFPLKNNGHDSFSTFSHQEYVTNTVAPHEFKESVQYQLLQHYDVDVLRPYNVKYIFDFSGIYESNYDRYVPASVYNNDVSLVKNDKDFFAKLLQHNPGKLRQVNDHILEVTDYLPRVAASDKLFSVPDDTLAAGARTFTRAALGAPLDYTTAQGALRKYTTKLTPLFNDPKHSRLDQKNGTFMQDVPVSGKGEASVYVNTSYATLTYELAGGRLTVYADTAGSLLLNDQALSTGTEGRRAVMQTAVDPGRQYYLSFKGTFTPLNEGKTERLGVGKAGDALQVFAAEGEEYIRNGSFEQELWQQQVSDCNRYDKDAQLSMQRTTRTASTGSAALELSATRHNACTDTTVEVKANTQYLLRFDYQSPNAQTANFFLSYGDNDKSFAKGFRAIADDRWHTATRLITTPDYAGKARLFLYALEQDGKEAIINRYDNVSFVRLTKISENTLPAPSQPYKEVSLAKGRQHRFTYGNSDYQYENLVTNPSFERGAWQSKVSDCNNYDTRPDIAMRVHNEASQGRQSLELRATRHDACTRTTINVTEDTDYLLTFDYRTSDAEHYGYALSFDDPQTTVTREQLKSRGDNEWHRATIKIHTPVRTSSLTLYLYAFEEKGTTSSVSYDNLNLIELPDFSDRFYVVQQPAAKLEMPSDTQFTNSHAAQKDIRITGATTPFFIQMSETYHPDWQLLLADKQTVSVPGRWLPLRGPAPAGTHFKAGGRANGWLVDPAALCRDGEHVRSGCTQNSDGSYDIRLAAIFAPQRWFTLAALVSWLTLLTCIIYLLANRRQESPTYQSVRRRILLKRSRR